MLIFDRNTTPCLYYKYENAFCRKAWNLPLLRWCGWESRNVLPIISSTARRKALKRSICINSVFIWTARQKNCCAWTYRKTIGLWKTTRWKTGWKNPPLFRCRSSAIWIPRNWKRRKWRSGRLLRGSDAFFYGSG